MSKAELNEKHQIDLMVSRDVSSAYLRARSAGVEVTILEGNDIVQIDSDKRIVIGSVSTRGQIVNQHYTLHPDA